MLLTKQNAQQLNFKEGLNDGFRAPDLAWLYGESQNFESGGSAISSNFWMGDTSRVKLFAEKIVSFYQNYIEEQRHLSGRSTTFDDIIFVGYWENTEANLAMVAVGCLSDFGYGLLSDYPTEKSQILKDEFSDLILVLADGNDNSIYELLSGYSNEVMSDEYLLAATHFAKADVFVGEAWLSDFKNENESRINLRQLMVQKINEQKINL